MLTRISFIRRAVPAITLAIGALALTPAASAQNAWPSKPIRLLVGYPPGGSIDLIARIVASELVPALGQPVVVENRPGASGNVAAAEVVRAAPDGYTFLVSSTTVETANPSLYKANFQPSSDLMAVNSVGRGAIYLVARPGLEANDVKDLIALAKANPGKLSFGSPGTGTQPHLAGELLKMNAGIQATHIPYKGSAPAIQDLMSNQIDFMLDPGIALPYIQAGKVKLLAVLSAKRSPYFPQVQTTAEQGVQGSEVDIWYGIWAPKGTPKDIVARLSSELQRAMAHATVIERLAKVNAEPAVIGDTAFRKLISQEGDVFSRLIRELGITAN